MLYYNEKGKITGETRDGIFKKSVKEKNIYRNLDAWGISLSILEDLQKNSIEQIELLDKKNKVLYKATVSLYYELGHEVWHKPYEPQQVLSRCHFTREVIK